MEAMDRLMQRELQRYSPAILDPVVVNCVDDIKMVVAKYDPAKNPQSNIVPISTVMEIKGEGQTPNKLMNVSAETKSKSQRDILMEGMDLIKNRMEMEVGPDGEAIEVNGKMMKPATVKTGTDGYSWIDPLIKHWFGGYRDGTHICWDLNGYQYRYDPYTHKLTRVKSDATVRSPATSPV